MNIRLWIASLAVVLIAGGLLLGLTGPVDASHSFTYNLPDDLGADDVVGNADLNGLSIDRSHIGAQNKLWLRWNWDVTALGSGETLNGCMLFDATGNGKSDYALCVGLDEQLQQVTGSPFAYQCNNQEDDNCGSNPVVLPNAQVACAVFTEVADLFAGENRPNPEADPGLDTRVRCSVNLDGIDDASPMNACSYAALPPSSSASDCVLAPSTTAFLVIEKRAGGDVNTTFDFALSPAGRDGGSSFQVSGAAASPPLPINVNTDHTLSEVNLPNGWVLEQADCQVNQQSIVNFDRDNHAVSGINIGAGQWVVCTFENVLYGEITFIKNVVGGNAQPSDWRFSIDSGQSDIAHNQTVLLRMGQQNVSEDGGVTNNADYSLTDASGACALVSGEIVLTVDSATGICTITNTVRPGSILVKKQTTPDGAAQTFSFSTSYSKDFTLADNGQYDSGPLTPGTYSVEEINIPLGWQLDSVNCSDGSNPNQIDLDPDETVICTFNNRALLANIGLQKAAVQSKINPGASATYHYTVTNPAFAPLSQVGVVDNKCSPVSYVSGNSNNNGFLEPGEKWLYTCARTLNVDTTNVATATAQTPLNAQVKATATAFVDVLPAVSLSKTANLTTLPEPGGAIAFTLTIQNDVKESVRVLQLTDDNSLSAACQALINQQIPANASVSCSYTVAYTAPGVYQNNANVSVRDDEHNQASDSASATVTITDVPSALGVNKTASPAALSEPGGDVEFTITVINNSAADTVTLENIWDDSDNDGNNNVTYAASDICDATSLAPSQQATCTYTQTLTGNPGNSVTNRATVTATDDDGAAVSNEDTAVVVIVSQDALLQVEKRPVPGKVAEIGDAVTFYVTITNTSPADAIITTALADSVYHDVTTSGHDGIVSTDCASGQKIEAQGGLYTCSFVAQVTGNAGEVHENTLVVSSEDGQGNPVVGVATAQVPISDLAAELTVTKSANPPSVPESGGNVTYSVLVTNSSAADVIRIDQVTDDQFGTLAEFCSAKLPVTLAPQETLSCTFNDFIQGPAGSIHTNLVTVSGIDDDSQPVSGKASTSVTFGNTPALLTVVKTATPGSVPESGGAVEYTVAITNASTADAITINSVQDDRFGNLAADCTPTPTTTIQPGEAITCLFTRFLQGDAGEKHTNQVTASGTADDGEAVLANGQVSVIFRNGN